MILPYCQVSIAYSGLRRSHEETEEEAGGGGVAGRSAKRFATRKLEKQLR